MEKTDVVSVDPTVNAVVPSAPAPVVETHKTKDIKPEFAKIIDAYAGFMNDPKEGAKFVKEVKAIFLKLKADELIDVRPKSKNAWIHILKAGVIVCRAHTLKTKYEIREATAKVIKVVNKKSATVAKP